MQDNLLNKSHLKRKILLYLDIKGITPYKFYKETGVTRGILDQNNGISEENLARFLAFAKDINLYWFFHDNGEVLRNIDNSMIENIRTKFISYKEPDYKDEMTTLRNDYIKTANKVIHLLEENAQLKERLRKYEGAD